MRYVAAYMLAALGAKSNPSAADIDKILSSVGIESDPARVSQICKELEGKNLQDLLAEGTKKLASMPSGGGAPAAAAAAPAGAAPEAKKEAKKEEKPESESEDEDMGFGLFD